jgi:hypothetical protein
MFFGLMNLAKSAVQICTLTRHLLIWKETWPLLTNELYYLFWYFKVQCADNAFFWYMKTDQADFCLLFWHSHCLWFANWHFVCWVILENSSFLPTLDQLWNCQTDGSFFAWNVFPATLESLNPQHTVLNFL